MELSQYPSLSAINRGAITLFEALVYFVIVIAVVSIAVLESSGLLNRNDANTEYSNAAAILMNGRAMLKTSGTYNFSSADAMTGALILFGGVPANMKIVGIKSSGNAKLQNVWGGTVTVQPVTPAGGQKTSFSLTYNAVPQEACVTLATKLSAMPNIGSTQVNGTNTSGAIDAYVAGSQCSADRGSIGLNTLTFTSNT